MKELVFVTSNANKVRGVAVTLVAGIFSFSFVFLSAMFLFAPRAHAATPSPVGYWTLDTSDFNWASGTVYDKSGNGNNGTIHDLDVSDEVAGQVGGGLQFNGSSSYISIPVNGAFPPSGNASRTVCVWFKPTDDSWTPDVNSIFEYGTAGGSGAFGIDMDNFPNIQFYTWGDDMLTAMGITGHKNDWLQICWVWDGNHTSLLYSNGVLRGSQAFGSGINTSQTEVSIGRSFLTSGYFPGVIDDVRMYDTALTDNQIESLYDDATNPAAIQNLAATAGEATSTITWDTATSTNSTVWYGTSSGAYPASTTSASLVTSHAITLTGLTSLTTYYYMVASDDGVGDTATSSEATFTTVDHTPPVLSSIVATAITSSTATITWTTNENASTQVVYGFTSAYGSTTAETDMSPRVISHSVPLDSLTACSTYHFAVVSSDASLNHVTSTDNAFTTAGCASLDPPVIVYVPAGGPLAPVSTFHTPAVSIPASTSASTTTSGAVTPITSSTAAVICPAYHFTRMLEFGAQGEDVRALQQFLNCEGFSLASSGSGSPGDETIYFVDRTRAALIRFQEAYADDVLAPIGATEGTGIFAYYSQKKAAWLTGGEQGK